MKRVPFVSILSRAIREGERELAERLADQAKWDANPAMKSEAIFYHDKIVRPLEQELEALKYLYKVETGTDY